MLAQVYQMFRLTWTKRKKIYIFFSFSSYSMLLSDSIPLAAPSFNKSFINNLQSNAPNKHIMWTFHLGVVKSYVLVLSSYCMFYLQSAVSLWLSGFSLSLSIVHLLHYYSEYFFYKLIKLKVTPEVLTK